MLSYQKKRNASVRTEKSIDTFLSSSLSSNYFDMPDDVRSLVVRGLTLKNDNVDVDADADAVLNEKPFTKEEMKILKIYSKNIAKQAKQLEKETKKKQKQLKKNPKLKNQVNKLIAEDENVSLSSSYHHHHHHDRDLSTPVASVFEKDEKEEIVSNQSEINYRKSFFTIPQPFDENHKDFEQQQFEQQQQYFEQQKQYFEQQQQQRKQMEYCSPTKSRNESLFSAKEEKEIKEANQKKALELQAEQERIKTLQQEVATIETMMNDNLRQALQNKTQTEHLVADTAGMKWKSKAFHKRTSGFLRNLNLKKILKYIGIAVVVLVIVAIIVTIICGIVMLMML